MSSIFHSVLFKVSNGLKDILTTIQNQELDIFFVEWALFFFPSMWIPAFRCLARSISVRQRSRHPQDSRKPMISMPRGNRKLHSSNDDQSSTYISCCCLIGPSLLQATVRPHIWHLGHTSALWVNSSVSRWKFLQESDAKRGEVLGDGMSAPRHTLCRCFFWVPHFISRQC